MVAAFGAACFAAGAWLTRSEPPPAPTPEPAVVVDAGAIDLLPDASLQLVLPAPPALPAVSR